MLFQALAGRLPILKLFGAEEDSKLEKVCIVVVMVMNLYSAFSSDVFKCALQASDL